MNDLDKQMQRFEGPYLESSDLLHVSPIQVTIASVIPPKTERSADKKLIDKPILTFDRAKKRLIVNKTNERILKAMFGKHASGWVGKKITLAVRVLDKAFGHENVPTIRIVPDADTLVPFSVHKHMGRPLSRPMEEAALPETSEEPQADWLADYKAELACCTSSLEVDEVAKKYDDGTDDRIGFIVDFAESRKSELDS